jgi:hypothetical protein
MSEPTDTYLVDRHHEPYSPSRLPYLEACPGWRGDGAPGPLAARGTRIGEILARYMIDGTLPDDLADGDAEAVDYGAQALDAIAAEWPDLIWTEERFVSTGIIGCGGYTDLLSVDDLLGEAVLIELKTGRGDRARACRPLLRC